MACGQQLYPICGRSFPNDKELSLIILVLLFNLNIKLGLEFSHRHLPILKGSTEVPHKQYEFFSKGDCWQTTIRNNQGTF